MVGPIDLQNVILNATAQSEVNTNALAQAAVGEAFKSIMNKKEEEHKSESVNEASNHGQQPVNRDKEHIKKRSHGGRIDLKA